LELYPQVTQMPW
jgi:Uncharacterized protein conserved in bacteria (DUF2194)